MATEWHAAVHGFSPGGRGCSSFGMGPSAPVSGGVVGTGWPGSRRRAAVVPAVPIIDLQRSRDGALGVYCLRYLWRSGSHDAAPGAATSCRPTHACQLLCV
jgi:hypothetical protein